MGRLDKPIADVRSEAQAVERTGLSPEGTVVFWSSATETRFRGLMEAEIGRAHV